jgi:hypothetical protein
MPRFSLKVLLIIFAITAIWFSTFADYSAAHDVRHSIKFFVIIAAGLLAFTLRGRRQMFWLGFAAAFLMSESRFMDIEPPFTWVFLFLPGNSEDADPLFGEGRYSEAAYESVRFFGTLIASVVAGLLGVFIYDQTHKQSDS